MKSLIKKITSEKLRTILKNNLNYKIVPFSLEKAKYSSSGSVARQPISQSTVWTAISNHEATRLRFSGKATNRERLPV